MVRYSTTPLIATDAANSGSGTLTDCKAVSVNDVQKTVELLNNEIVNIPGSYRWKVENGMPMLDFSSGQTGIEQTVMATDKSVQTLFNLQGQRVVRPSKGIYIQGRKKIVFK